MHGPEMQAAAQQPWVTVPAGLRKVGNGENLKSFLALIFPAEEQSLNAIPVQMKPWAF